MSLKERVSMKIRYEYRKKTSLFRQIHLKKRSFSIISNNCWGGRVYQSYKLPYLTPTIGLFFMADDFMDFVTNLYCYLQLELQFVSFEASKWYNYLKSRKYDKHFPIGRLNDIEIMFLHYESEKEAHEKWTRRCQVIDWNNVIIKFNDQNLCSEKHIVAFDSLPYKNKICFSATAYKDLGSVVHIAKGKHSGHCVAAEQEPYGKSRFLNVTRFINNIQQTDVSDFRDKIFWNHYQE